MNLDDTIVAIATPFGRGGIGVVRLAGPEAKTIASPMLRLNHELQPGRAVLAELVEPPGAHWGDQAGALKMGELGPRGEARPSQAVAATRIDEVVVTYFQKPYSYTTDDIVEISAHGSPVVLGHMVELAIAAGARVAEPGEFTMRAFLNGRIDLTQAEAVRDLVESQTVFQAKVAAQQLQGTVSRRLQPIKQKLLELIALLEAGIDFADDDVAVLPSERILKQLAEVRAPLEQLADSFSFGRIVHQGLTLAIVGRPNVGKSSLFNRLIERERAIVTATPGTTRDLITETVAIEGIPIQLVDTAGIRRALDEAECLGIRKAMEALADADLVLVVLDSSQPLTAEDEELLNEIKKRPAIVVENKSDLARGRPRTTSNEKPLIETSAATGAGMAELRAEILRHIGGDKSVAGESGLLTSARHQGLVHTSLNALGNAKDAVHRRVPHEMILLDLYNALTALDEITGSTTPDDILNLIFSTFCIGK